MALQTGTLGKFWFGPQIARETAATTFYAFRGNALDLAPGQQFRNIGPMVGGSFLPADSIKTAAFSGGGVTMPPILDDYLGWLLYAFTGSVTSNDMGDNSYEHYFPSGADSTAPTTYLTGRRQIPGGTVHYEQMEDLVISRMLFNLAGGEYVSARFDMMGRTITAPDGAAWVHTPKGYDSVPISCRGGVELPDGSSLETASAATIEVVNVIPPINRVLTVGSYYPYDYPILTRNITFSFDHLYETDTLYELLYWNGTAWQPTIYSTTFDVYVQSASDITGASDPYELKFWSANMEWTCEPLRLVGGDLILLRITGTMAAATSGFDWYVRLKNNTEEYVWPT